MNTHLSNLVELSQIDKNINNFEPERLRIEAPLNSLLEEKTNLTAKIESIEEDTKDTLLKIKQNNNHLEDLSLKIDELAKKTASVKTQKEAKALNLEDELAREQINFTNDEISRFEKSLDYKKDNLQETKDALSEVLKKVDDVNETIKSKIEDVNKSKTSMIKKRNKLVKNIDTKVFDFYDKIHVWAKDTTVVPIKKQACYGCYMRIGDNDYNSLLLSDEIHNCPHCGRIIYLADVEK